MYFALKHGQAMPYECIRWQLAERFGWTLDYIDGLSMVDLLELNQVDDGRYKANHSILP